MMQQCARSSLRYLSLAMALLAVGTAANAQTSALPADIAATGETAVMTLHAEGAQVYECKADSTGKLVWSFREPVATLMQDGKTVGRHYAGPNWELSDSSAVVGRVAGRAPGATAADIALLKLDVTSSRGSGLLTGVTTIQRINTKGGQLEGACEVAGTFRSVAYATDYVFLKR
jgi:Protein of unknown function (DUF3455)